jgi:hypothetical protein
VLLTWTHRISTFKKKSGAYSVSIVYEVTDDTPFYPQGYVCPDTTYEAPQGIHSFPFIYCHPKVKSFFFISAEQFVLKQLHIGTPKQTFTQHYFHHSRKQTQTQ